MEKILFIAYQFPPKGGPGVQRSIKFVQNLKKFGYDPIVLTIDIEDNHKQNELMDESLLEAVPKDIKVVRTKSGTPYRLTKLLMKMRIYRLFWFLFYGLLWEKSAMWPRKARDVAKRLVKENDIKLVYTTSGPYSSMILGNWLQKKLKVKWVADLRDPFTDAYAWQFPSKAHWYFARYFEKKTFSKPDHLIVNTNEVRKLYIKRNLIHQDKISVLTNGF